MGDFLFGSTEDAQVTGQAQTLTNSQLNLFNKLLPILNKNVGVGVDSYPGQYTPDANATQQKTFDFVENLLSGGNQTYNQGIDSMESILQPYDDSSARQYWNDAIKEPSMQIWEDEILPQTLEPFVAQGALDSGAARRSVNKAGTDLATNLSATLADVLYKDKTQNTQNQFSAVSNILDMIESPVKMGLSSGDAQYNIQAGQGAEGYNDWLFRQNYNNPWLASMFPALQTEAMQPIVQGPTQTTGLLQDVGVPLASAWLSSGSWF